MISAPIPGPSRRRCLTALLASLGGGGALLRLLAPGPSANLEAGALIALLDSPCQARAIGTACLGALPAAERTAEALTRALRAGLPRGRSAGAGELGRLVSERLRRDFAEGAVIAADGWFLSLTEARLYALAALA